MRVLQSFGKGSIGALHGYFKGLLGFYTSFMWVLYGLYIFGYFPKGFWKGWSPTVGGLGFGGFGGFGCSGFRVSMSPQGCED